MCSEKLKLKYDNDLGPSCGSVRDQSGLIGKPIGFCIIVLYLSFLHINDLGPSCGGVRDQSGLIGKPMAFCIKVLIVSAQRPIGKPLGFCIKVLHIVPTYTTMISGRPAEANVIRPIY